MNAKNNEIMVSSETMEKLEQCARWMNQSVEEVLEEAVSDLFYELENE